MISLIFDFFGDDVSIPLSDSIINMYLVYKNARQACLIETANYINIEHEIKDYLQILFDIAESMELKVLREDLDFKYPRYLVCNNNSLKYYLSEENKIKNKREYEREHEKLIGKILGFYCYDHDYADYNDSNRLGTDIFIYDKNNKYEAEISQMCDSLLVNKIELKENLKEEKKKILKALGKNFRVKYYITDIDSIRTRLEKLEKKDYKYIRKNFSIYINDLKNFYGNGDIDMVLEELDKTKYTDSKHYLLVKIWEKIYNNDLEFKFFYKRKNWNLKLKTLKSILD